MKNEQKKEENEQVIYEEPFKERMTRLKERIDYFIWG